MVALTRAGAARKKAIFPFLSLPAEIRNRIYQLHLVEPNGLDVWKNAIKEQEDPFRAVLRHPLLCANSQIRRESLSVLYSVNTINVEVEHMEWFLDFIGDEARSHLCKAYLKGNWPVVTLATFPGLKHIKINSSTFSNYDATKRWHKLLKHPLLRHYAMCTVLARQMEVGIIKISGPDTQYDHSTDPRSKFLSELKLRFDEKTLNSLERPTVLARS